MSTRKRGFLVVTRKVHQEVIIELEDGSIIEVALINIQGKQARIGIGAGRDCKIHRREVYDKMQAEKEEAQPTFI